MQATVLCTLLLGATAACHTSTSLSPDGTETSADDAPPPGAAGLSVVWSTTPQTIPGSLPSNITITSMTFAIMDLRVIGDAGPGDPRTTMDNFQITWSAGMTPANVAFANAPSGLYSKVSIIADGELINDSYEIDGTVKVGNASDQPFKIHDRSPIAIELDTSTMLDPGKSATVGIEVALDQSVPTIDFTMLDTDDGALDLDTLDSQMADFRTKLINSFVIAPQHGND